MKYSSFHHYLRRVLCFAAIASLLTNSFLAPISYAADSNQLFITPASSQMNTGTTFTVNVKRYDPNSSPTGTVNGTVTYPANLLKVIDTPRSGSAYGSPNISVGSGTINFSGTLSQASGSIAQIFGITFQAIGGGTATVGFGGNSQVNNSATVYKNGVYTIINPTPSQQPQPSATPKASAVPVPSPSVIASPSPVEPTPTSDPEPQPTPDPTGLIDNVTIDPLYSSATIVWKVNGSNGNATMSYGKSATKLETSAQISKQSDGSFKTTIYGLEPGVRYYFVINGTADGGKTGNYSGTIITRGFPVVMTITENNAIAQSAQVKIANRTYTATAEGKVSIGLAMGDYSGTITTQTSSLTINLTVASKTIPTDGSSPPAQAFSYNLTSSPLEQGPGSATTILTFIGVLIGGTAIVALGFVGFMAYRRRQFENDSGSVSSGSTVIVEDGYDWRSEQEQTEMASPPTPQTTSSYEQTTVPMNSVHITDDEPADMFDRAADIPLPTPNLEHYNEKQQNPNQPHSTKL